MPPEDLKISAAELKSLLEAGRVSLLDVREAHEVQSGMIPGAMHIPLGQLQARCREIPGGRPVVVYCAHGMRSLQGAHFLRTLGLNEVKSLNGGIAHWSSQGGTIVRP